VELVRKLLRWMEKSDHKGVDSAVAVAVSILGNPKHREPYCRAINEAAAKQGQVRCA
jgi:hypothetical protein